MTAARQLLYAAVALAGVIFTIAACGDPARDPDAIADEAYAVLDELTSQYSPRETGTADETAAALHLQNRLDAIGYDTSRQTFGTSYVFDSSYMFYTGVPLDSLENEASLDPIRPHLSSGPPAIPPMGYVTGLLTPVGDTSQVDAYNPGLEGRIALIESSVTVSTDDVVQRVRRAGAVGAIIVSDGDDAFGDDRMTFVVTMENAFPFRTSPDPRIITVISVSMDKGDALLELLERGDVTASIKVDVEQAPAWNLVAHMPGTADDSPRQVILGAHYDTVAETQGANDNGSGLAVLLTAARHIAEREYPFDVQIVLFGAKNHGLLGSKHYVETMTVDEIGGTIAVLNFDSLGAGSALTATGDPYLTSEAIDIGEELDAPIARRVAAFALADDMSFEEAGIPALLLSSSDAYRIDPTDDDIERINPDLLGYAAEIAIAMLDRLAE